MDCIWFEQNYEKKTAFAYLLIILQFIYFYNQIALCWFKYETCLSKVKTITWIV